MAKIDTTKIVGYDTMSAEDKIAALEGYDVSAPAPAETSELTKLKTMLSKANSEAADWKRKWNEKLTETERAEAERAEADKALRDELENLKRDKAVSGYVAKYLEVGYDAESANRAAKAMVDNDYTTIFAEMKTFVENKTKDIEAKALNKQPGLTPGTNPAAKDIEKAEQEKMAKWFGAKPVFNK